MVHGDGRRQGQCGRDPSSRNGRSCLLTVRTTLLPFSPGASVIDGQGRRPTPSHTVTGHGSSYSNTLAQAKGDVVGVGVGVVCVYALSSSPKQWRMHARFAPAPAGPVDSVMVNW
jgi:hypothetical protein